MLRRTLALALSLSIVLMTVPLSAAPSSLGRISGIATTVGGGQFAGQIARLRSLDIGHVADVTTTSTAGSFAFNGVSSGNYVVELMTDGRVVGTSTPIAVTAKNNIVDGVTARAVAPAAAQAQAGALAGSFWGSTIGIITAIVIVAVVVTVIVVATNDEASPSR
jgi:hypothetical protein